MKKLIAMLVSCMMLGCTFVACGKTDSSSEKETASTTASSEDKTTEASEEKTTEDSTEESSEKKTEAETEAETENKGGDKGSLEENILGKWESKKMIMEGMELTEFFGMPISAMMHFTIEKDGKCTFASPLDEENAGDIACTWTITGTDSLTIKINEPSDEEEEEPVNLKYKDGKLIIVGDEDESTGSLIIEKVDKFTEFDAKKWAEDMQNAFGTLDIEINTDDVNIDFDIDLEEDTEE